MPRRAPVVAASSSGKLNSGLLSCLSAVLRSCLFAILHVHQRNSVVLEASVALETGGGFGWPLNSGSGHVRMCWLSCYLPLPHSAAGHGCIDWPNWAQSRILFWDFFRIEALTGRNQFASCPDPIM